MRESGLKEREIVRGLVGRLGISKRELPLGFDDDVSVYKVSGRNWLVLKTDSLVGSTDIPSGMSLEQASRKAIVAVVSDFAAKGVRPIGLLFALGLRPPVTPKMVDDIARGIKKGAREYGCKVLGGDTGESRDLFIDCIGFGFAEPQTIIRRHGARLGDTVAVTGLFGRTTAGLQILLSRNKVLARRFPRLVDSIIHPAARLSTGLKLAATGAVNCSIDSSDGLAWSLHELARLNRVNIVLDRVPVAPESRVYADRLGLDEDELALYGGEEYELVLTVERNQFPSLKKKIPSLIDIGIVEAGRGEVLLRSEESVERVEPRGWEHFEKYPRSLIDGAPKHRTSIS